MEKGGIWETVELPSEKGHTGRKPAEPDAREVVGVSLFGLGGRKVEPQSHGDNRVCFWMFLPLAFSADQLVPLGNPEPQ